MKKQSATGRTILCVILAAMLLLGALLPALSFTAGAASIGTSNISAKVTVGGTARRDVQVHLIGENYSYTASATSDAEGKVYFSNVPAGSGYYFRVLAREDYKEYTGRTFKVPGTTPDIRLSRDRDWVWDKTTTTDQLREISTQDAKDLIQRAIDEAGPDATALSVQVRNIDKCSYAAMRNLVNGANGLPVRLHADTIAHGLVDVRITLDPSKVPNAVFLSASSDTGNGLVLKNRLTSIFSNVITVVSTDQVDFGQPITLAVRADARLNLQTLVFYSYNSTDNTYHILSPTPEYRVDANGYVHFTVPSGGNFIITDKPLSK